MSFRCNTPIAHVKKRRRCYWCAEHIEVGDAAVKVTGHNDDFFSATFHPECWRVEVHDFWLTDHDDCWPWRGECQRGLLDERGHHNGAPPKYKSDPVSAQEARYPHDFKEQMLCQKTIQKGMEVDPIKSTH